MAKQQQGSKYSDRYPGAKPLGGGDMMQWEKIGQEVVGEFVAVKVYKNGHIANVLTSEGLVAFSAPAMLATVLNSISKGTRIAIVFSGEKPPKKGEKGDDGKPLSPTKLFEVYELEE